MKNFSLLGAFCGFLSSIALAAPQANIDQPLASEATAAVTTASRAPLPLDLKIAYGTVVPLALASTFCWGAHSILFIHNLEKEQKKLIKMATIIPALLLSRSAHLLYNGFKGRLFTTEAQPSYDKHTGREIGGFVTGVTGAYCLYNLVMHQKIPSFFGSETFQKYWTESLIDSALKTHSDSPYAAIPYAVSIGYLLTECYIQCRQLFLAYKHSKQHPSRQ